MSIFSRKMEGRWVSDNSALREPGGHIGSAACRADASRITAAHNTLVDSYNLSLITIAALCVRLCTDEEGEGNHEEPQG